MNQSDEDSCSLDSKVETKKKSMKEFAKLKKSAVVKNTNAVEVQALEEVTEQTLRVREQIVFLECYLYFSLTLMRKFCSSNS